MASHDFRYDAFISYAHEDADAVEWLHELLRTYWVPGRSRRTIFLDRHSMSAGGGLGGQLRVRIRESRFLIVCWSRAAMASPWIALEIEEFLKTHPPKDVLVCTVGAADDDPALPDVLQAIERETGDPLYRVEIRNFASDRRAAERSALSLLAPLVDLPGKDEILDRRKKRRILSAFAAATTLTITLAAWYGWKRWLDTPDGQHYLTVRRVLAAAERDTIDDPKLVSTAEALAKTDGAGALKRFSRFARDDDFRALVLAAGYASLSPPDCAAALRHARSVDAENGDLWARAILITERRCGGSVIAGARPETPDARWPLELARAGLTAEAQRVRPSIRLTAEEEVQLAIELRATIGGELLRRWRAEAGEFFHFGAAAILEELDAGGRLRDPMIAPLLDFAGQVSMNEEGVNVWIHSQQVAAALAGAGRLDEARALLQKRPGRVKTTRDPGDASGWAWRALAQHRLGDRVAAEASFAEAFACARTQIPASRTWGEWRDIARSLALTGDWKRARAAADAAGQEIVRIQHNFQLLEDWAHR